MNEENMNMNEEVNEVEENEDYEEVNSGLGWKIIGGILATAGVIWGGLKLKKMIVTKREKDIEIVEIAEGDVENEVNENVDGDKKKTKKKKIN